MTEQNHNNLLPDDHKEAGKADNDFIPDNARPLCPRCLKPCNPLQYYCDNCDSNDAVNPLAPYMAFVNIRFNYAIFLTMWRKLWYDKDISIIGRLFYLFIITMFVPVFLVVGLPSFLIFKIPHKNLRKATTITLFIIAVVLLIIFARYRLFTGLVSHPIRFTVR